MVSTWVLNDYNLLINGIYWGYNPLILTFDPNFQCDILVVFSKLAGKKTASGMGSLKHDDGSYICWPKLYLVLIYIYTIHGVNLGYDS